MAVSAAPTPAATTESPEPTGSTEPTQTPTQSSPPEDDPTPPPANGNLSKKWTSYEFQIGGKVYELPLKYSKLAADGWKPDSSATLSRDIKARQYTILFTTLRKDDQTVTVQFANLDGTTKKIKDTYVGGVRQSKTVNQVPMLLLPGAVTLGSTTDEVKSLYGSPTKKSDSKTSLTWTYEGQRYQDVVITFDPNTKKATTIKMSNFYK